MNQNDPDRLSRQEVSQSTTTGGVDPEAKGPNSYSSGSSRLLLDAWGCFPFMTHLYQTTHGSPWIMDGWAPGIALNGLAAVAWPPSEKPMAL